MRLQKSLDRILELFLIFRTEVQAHNQTGQFNINRLAEDVLIPIFRDAFGCQYLRNLNKERQNYAGIDLADDQAWIAFQVTSDPKIDKVKDTLSKVVAHKYHLRYETIYVYVLTEKQKKYAKKPLQDITKGHFKFDPDVHTIDAADTRARVVLQKLSEHTRC
jgi:uncharacterized protein YlaI